MDRLLIEEDEETLLEECPTCKGYAFGCMTCWDFGYIPHACDSALVEWAEKPSERV